MRLPVLMRSIALLIVTALLTASCTGFPRGWSAAKTAMAPDAVSGAWIGRWRSETNGHSGGLRCVAERRDADTWHFRYRASWAKIFCAGFSMNAAVNPDGKGGYTVSGSKDLGKMFGGLFTSRGTIRDGSFHAQYESKFDRGTMEMQRVQTAGVETNIPRIPAPAPAPAPRSETRSKSVGVGVGQAAPLISAATAGRAARP